jgi:Skp family chaperone for outer membrane proteins
MVCVVLASAGGKEKVASLNVERTIRMTDEGRHAFNDLSHRLEPRQNELKAMNAGIETLKQQLSSHSPAPSDAERAKLQSELDSEQELFESALQAAKKNAADQQNDIAKRILNKMADIVLSVVHEEKLSAVIDISPTTGLDMEKPWPQGPIFWYASPEAARKAATAKLEADITDAVVSKYNATYSMPTNH